MADELFDPDHEAFRESVRAFLAGEIAPSWEDWTAAGEVPAEAYTRAAAQGIGGIAVPEEHGGAGVDDPRFDAVVGQECERDGLTGYGLVLAEHAEAARWLVRRGTEEVRSRWLPGLAAGEHRAALAIGPAVERTSETSLELLDVAGGATASVVVVDLGDADGQDVAVIDLTARGVARRPVGALGALGVDAADVTVDDLGTAGVVVRGGAPELRAVSRRAWAVLAAAGARAAFDLTVDYVNERQVFSAPVAAFGNTRSELVGLVANLRAADTLVADLLRDGDRPGSSDAALALLRAVAARDAAADLGLQLHGGYGYMLEYPISRAFADARYLRLHAHLDGLVDEVAPGLGLVASAGVRA